MKKSILLPCFILLVCAVLAGAGCAQKSSPSSSAASVSNDMLYEAEAAYDSAYAPQEPAMLFAASGSTETSTSSTLPENKTQTGDLDVRKIVYDGSLDMVCDDPADALQRIIDKTVALGGYLASSNTYRGEGDNLRCSATLKVPSDKLEELVTAAKASGKVESYSLTSDDITGEYYDIAARLTAAQAEEKQLLAMLEKCATVEEMLLVRESLASVRADIESYQGRINLWDQLVAYATLELSIRQTPKTAVGEESSLIELWKASDVWQKMSDGFVNSGRFLVNAVGAVGIFLAVAILPAGLLFLCIGLPIILHQKKKKRLAAEKAAPKAGEAADKPEQETPAPEKGA